MTKTQYLHKLVTHNLGVFIAMCYMDFHNLFSIVDEWLYIKRGKGDSLKYHASKMASVFSDDFIVNNAPFFITVDLVRLLKLSDKHSLYFRMLFHNEQFAQYIFSKENLEWIEVLKNIRSGDDYVNAAEETKLTSARQIRHVLGDDVFYQFVKLPIADALALIEKRFKEESLAIDSNQSYFLGKSCPKRKCFLCLIQEATPQLFSVSPDRTQPLKTCSGVFVSL